MPNLKISALPSAATITGTETVPLVQAGATKAATVSQLLALVVAGAPGNLDTFFETATQMGLDEATVTTLQALVAGKAPLREVSPTGDATGVQDVAALNTALTAAATGYPVVKGKPGSTFTINAPIVVPSGVRLDMTGCTVTLLDGRQCNMLRNAAVTPTRTLSDAAISTATPTTLTSATAAFTAADVGRSVSIAGAGSAIPGNAVGPTPLSAQILAVTNATTVTLDTAAGTTVTGAALNIYQRDTNIEIVGGTWNCGINGWGATVPASPSLMTFQFKHFDGLKVHDLTMNMPGTWAQNGSSYHINTGDFTNLNAWNLTFHTPGVPANGDGFNIHGPARGAFIHHLFGDTGDDFVSLHTADGQSQLWDTVGDIINVAVEDVFGTSATSLFKVHAGGTTHAAGITVKTLHGWSNAPAIKTYAYATDAGLDSLYVSDVDVDGPHGILIDVGGNAPNSVLSFSGIVWRRNTPTSVITTQVGSTLGKVRVDGLDVLVQCANVVSNHASIADLELENIGIYPTASATGAIVSTYSDGSIDKLSISNVYANFASGLQSAILLNHGTIGEVNFSRIVLKNGGVLFQSDPSTVSGVLTMNDVVLDNAYRLMTVKSAVEAVINNINVKSLSTTGLIWGDASTGPAVTVRGTGMKKLAAVVTFANMGTAKPIVYNGDFQCDLSALSNAVVGAQAWNTNAALSCGVGPCISSGSGTAGAWKNLATGATY